MRLETRLQNYPADPLKYATESISVVKPSKLPKLGGGGFAGCGLITAQIQFHKGPVVLALKG
jgi:hypothetical protein